MFLIIRWLLIPACASVCPAREAVRAVGRIALSVPDASGLLERLLLFLDSGAEHIVAESLVAMKDLLRRYPDLAATAMAPINDMAPAAVDDADAKCALIWILGAFGGLIDAAPYSLEPLAESFSSEEPSVRLALLSAAAQLFFARPAESQKLLGRLLAAGLADSHQDVHDRALLITRCVCYTAKVAFFLTLLLVDICCVWQYTAIAH